MFSYQEPGNFYSNLRNGPIPLRQERVFLIKEEQRKCHFLTEWTWNVWPIRLCWVTTLIILNNYRTLLAWADKSTSIWRVTHLTTTLLATCTGLAHSTISAILNHTITTCISFIVTQQLSDKHLNHQEVLQYWSSFFLNIFDQSKMELHLWMLSYIYRKANRNSYLDRGKRNVAHICYWQKWFREGHSYQWVASLSKRTHWRISH